MGGMSTRNEIKARLGILAEPPAKARMGRWTLEDSAGWGDMSKQWTATINGTQWAIVVDGATGTGSLMRMQPGRAPQTVQRGPVEQLKRYAESLRASRPGAKAKMGYRVGEKVQDKHTGQMAMIGEVLPVNAPANIQRRKQLDRLEPEYRLVDPTTGKHLGYAKEHRLLRASRPGAKSTHAAADKPGRKVMAESDPAVSAKIRKLMAEGKPQKQAVAIALDMKRRGEI